VSHIALAFGYIGHLYAITCSLRWDARDGGAYDQLWQTNMDAWFLSALGRPS
jgi:hypothetical protein